jgi:hypothetical protein
MEIFPNVLKLIFIVVGFVSVVILAFILSRVFRKKDRAKTLTDNRTAIDIPRPTAKYFKRCPACQSTYTDESLNYCLTDGTPLDHPEEIKTSVFLPR